jgi:hypothetical protein
LWPFKKVFLNDYYSINYYDWSQMYHAYDIRDIKDKVVFKPKSTNRAIEKIILSKEYIKLYYYNFKDTYMKYNMFFKRKAKINYP